jgi:hypothetical protein
MWRSENWQNYQPDSIHEGFMRELVFDLSLTWWLLLVPVTLIKRVFQDFWSTLEIFGESVSAD